MQTGQDHADLLIIGGGVLGGFHAYHALQRGLRVTLLERKAAPRGATVRNFGQVVPSGLDQEWQRFGRASLQIYESLQDQLDLSVRRQGSIYLASDEEEVTLIEELHAINAAADYPSELWTAERCRHRYPQLRTDYCQAGLFFPEEISVNPRIMIHQLHRYLSEHHGYQSHFQAGVRELGTARDGRVAAITNEGIQFIAEKALVCCGSEFQTLYPALFRASDLEVVKLQMLRLRPQRGAALPGNILTGRSIRRYESFAQCPSWATIKAKEPANGFAKDWGVHLLFKQEADGGIILGDSHEYAKAAEADTLDFGLRGDISEYLIQEGQKIFDLPAWDIEASWCGMYSQTRHPSGIFVETVEANIHIVTGIGGKGMTSSAGFAEHLLGEIYHD